MKYLLIVITLLILLVPTVAFAQDSTPIPVPSAAEPVTPTNPLSEALAYLVVLASTLPLWAGAVFIGVDVAKEQIKKILAYADIKDDYPAIRSFITLIAVFVASWQSVTQLGYNIFTLPNAPDIAMSDNEQRFATVIVVALTSIAIHLWTTYRGRLGLVAQFNASKPR